MGNSITATSTTKGNEPAIPAQGLPWVEGRPGTASEMQVGLV